MLKKESFAGVGIVTALLTAGAIALSASPALAACAPGTSTGCQSVSGTTLNSLALTIGTPATFGTTFAPGVSNDQSTGGTLLVTDTSPSWHLSIQDQGTGAGTLVADTTLSPAGACTTSESQLGSAVKVSVTPAVANPLTNFSSAGSTQVSGTPTVVASASSQLLANDTLDTTYSQSIGNGEVLKAGCIYDMTATYTLGP